MDRKHVSHALYGTHRCEVCGATMAGHRVNRYVVSCFFSNGRYEKRHAKSASHQKALQADSTVASIAVSTAPSCASDADTEMIQAAESLQAIASAVPLSALDFLAALRASDPVRQLLNQSTTKMECRKSLSRP